MADSYVRAALRLFFINKFISVARNSDLIFSSDTCLMLRVTDDFYLLYQ